MVINSDPALAYLMIDNPMSVQVLVMAHVLGHVNFFKNNYLFKQTRPEDVLGTFKRHARIIESFIDQYGIEEVEKWLDAAMAFEWNINRSLIPEESYENIQQDKEDINKSNLLLFIRDHASIPQWKKDILTIVYEEAVYFLPQIETKIINEGWASFWHYKLCKELDLPFNLYMEVIKLHNSVVHQGVGQVNPYALGFTIWTRLAEEKEIQDLYNIVEVSSDSSFIRRFLTDEIAKELKILSYARNDDDDLVVDETSKSDFKQVKQEFLRWIGSKSIPVVRVKEIKSNTLILEFESDGRTLEDEYKDKTLKYAEYLWGNPVSLEIKVLK
jgi:stage V sporulation protein R